MSTAALSKYAENQFESATRFSFALMGELLADTITRATGATVGISQFSGPLSDLSMVIGAWNSGAAVLATAEAILPSKTFAFEDKINSLTRKPDADTASLLESWDTIIRGAVAYQGPTYMLLLPNGREGLTRGTYEQRVDALEVLASNLAAQAGKPTLIALGGTVSTFATAARALRVAQGEAKGALNAARENLEATRLLAAAQLYSLIAVGMTVWKLTPERVDTLFDVSILRRPALVIPDAPADTTWTPGTRTLSTTAMPANGTRLAAWRIAPGGMPEQLATGEPGETAVQIPVTITWVSGGLYQIWLVALNSKGPSAPGPIQSWTAP